MHWRKWRYWRYRQKRQYRHAKNCLRQLRQLRQLEVKVSKVSRISCKNLISIWHTKTPGENPERFCYKLIRWLLNHEFSLVNLVTFGETDEVNTCSRHARNDDRVVEVLCLVNDSAGSGDNLHSSIVVVT